MRPSGFRGDEIHARIRAFLRPGLFHKARIFYKTRRRCSRKENRAPPDLFDLRGTSDARFIRAYCPVLEFGLVGATAHMVDEHVAVADIEALTEIYMAILDDYFSKK